MRNISDIPELTPDQSDDIILKVTMPGKELRTTTIEKREEAERRQEVKKTEQQLSPDPDVDWLSAITRPRNATSDFVSNMQQVNTQIDQQFSAPTVRESGPIRGMQPRPLTMNDPFINPSTAHQQPTQPVTEQPRVASPSYSQEAPGEKEVQPATVQSAPTQQPVQRRSDPLDPYNIFGRVQPERDDAKPTGPPHMMTQKARDSVAMLTQRIFDSDIAIKRKK